MLQNKQSNDAKQMNQITLCPWGRVLLKNVKHQIRILEKSKAHSIRDGRLERDGKEMNLKIYNDLSNYGSVAASMGLPIRLVETQKASQKVSGRRRVSTNGITAVGRAR
jgi:hypothetical protein